MVTHLVKEKGVKYGTSQDLANIHCYGIGFSEDSGYDESGKSYLPDSWAFVLNLSATCLKQRLTLSLSLSQKSPGGRLSVSEYNSTRPWFPSK